jgi:integrase
MSRTGIRGNDVASIWRDSRSGNFLIKFHFAGKRYTRSCETQKEKDAKSIKVAVEETIGFLQTGRLTMPEGVANPGVWIMSGGKLNEKPKNETPRLTMVGEVCEAYYQDQLDKAETTLKGEANHINHLKRIFGEKTALESLTLETMQSYVNDRSKADNRYGGKVSGSTVKKELTTFIQIWDWARQRGFVNRPCPIKDPHRPRKWAVKIRKPEDTEKFMTWAEIERRIGRGGLSLQQQNDLWKFLYLDETQIAELLEYVQENAAYPFIFPMFVVAAYTGARRSEICRSLIDDFKFTDALLTIRERKRRKDRASTTRDVPLQARLAAIMQSWFKDHPGGQHTITPPLAMPRRKANLHLDGLSRDEAHHHFKQTLANSKWKVIRGFHVLRHSFGAICTRAGIPMNVIAKWMGHTTDEMMKLYQHVFPQDEQTWMDRFPL